MYEIQSTSIVKSCDFCSRLWVKIESAMCVLVTFSILRLVFLHHQVDDTERSLYMMEGGTFLCEVLHLRSKLSPCE